MESDRGKEWYKSIFQKFLKNINIPHYSRFTDKRPNIAERVIRTKRNLLKSQCLKKENLIGYQNFHLLLNNIIILSTAQ